MNIQKYFNPPSIHYDKISNIYVYDNTENMLLFTSNIADLYIKEQVCFCLFRFDKVITLIQMKTRLHEIPQDELEA